MATFQNSSTYSKNLSMQADRFLPLNLFIQYIHSFISSFTNFIYFSDIYWVPNHVRWFERCQNTNTVPTFMKYYKRYCNQNRTSTSSGELVMELTEWIIELWVRIMNMGFSPSLAVFWFHSLGQITVFLSLNCFNSKMAVILIPWYWYKDYIES